MIPKPIEAQGIGAAVLLAGKPNEKIQVFRLFLTADKQGELVFKSGGVDPLTGTIHVEPGIPLILELNDIDPWFETATGEDFVLEILTGIHVGGQLKYRQG